MAIVKSPVLIIDACQYSPNYNYCLLDALERNGEGVIHATTKFAYGGITPPAGIKVWYCFFYLARLVGKVTSSRRVRQVLRGLEYPFDMAALLLYILIRRIKVVHFMWTALNNFDYHTIRIMQAMGCKVVFTAHNPFPHDEKDGQQAGYTRIHHAVDHIIALTNYTRDEIVRRSHVRPEKISVIPHGDYDALFERYGFNAELAEKVRAKAGDRHIISFLGGIRPYKGLDYFIDAFKLIKQNMPESFFLVAGSVIVSGNKREIEARLKNSCNADDLWFDIRYVPVEDLKAYLSVTDVLVQPYIGASQSGNMVMAYSAGIPVISTDVGGLGEMTEDGKTGFVIPPGDSEAIANGVVRCFEGDNYPKMSAAAKVLAWDRYNWRSIASETIEVYSSFD